MWKRIRKFLAAGLGLALLTGCAISLTDATPVPTVAVPSVAPPGKPSATPEGAATDSGGPAWSELGLTGRLLYSLGAQGIQELDLTTGENKLIFAPPPDAWLTAASVAPDGHQMALAYAPPPAADRCNWATPACTCCPAIAARGRTAARRTSLTLLLDRVDPHEAYFSPVWSADSRAPLHGALHAVRCRLQLALQIHAGAHGRCRTASPKILLPDALWPNVSPDGQLLAYVVSDPKDNANYLCTWPARTARTRGCIVTPDQFLAVDSPFFAPDSSYVIFSAVGEGPAGTPTPALSWLDRLLGVRAPWPHPGPQRPLRLVEDQRRRHRLGAADEAVRHQHVWRVRPRRPAHRLSERQRAVCHEPRWHRRQAPSENNWFRHDRLGEIVR